MSLIKVMVFPADLDDIWVDHAAGVASTVLYVDRKSFDVRVDMVLSPPPDRPIGLDLLGPRLRQHVDALLARQHPRFGSLKPGRRFHRPDKPEWVFAKIVPIRFGGNAEYNAVCLTGPAAGEMTNFGMDDPVVLLED